MLTALLFYTFLFMALVVVPAGLILVVLLFLEHERRFWKRVTPVIEPIGATMGRWPVIRDLRNRFPHTASLLGLWFFLGVLQDIVAKDPLVILNIRLHNTVPLFRTTGMTWFMLALTQLGSTTVLSLLCC